jgi:hypothetical protein
LWSTNWPKCHSAGLLGKTRVGWPTIVRLPRSVGTVGVSAIQIVCRLTGHRLSWKTASMAAPTSSLVVRRPLRPAPITSMADFILEPSKIIPRPLWCGLRQGISAGWSVSASEARPRFRWAYCQSERT